VGGGGREKAYGNMYEQLKTHEKASTSRSGNISKRRSTKSVGRE
jgi:hypothetical protein